MQGVRGTARTAEFPDAGLDKESHQLRELLRLAGLPEVAYLLGGNLGAPGFQENSPWWTEQGAPAPRSGNHLTSQRRRPGQPRPTASLASKSLLESGNSKAEPLWVQNWELCGFPE